jgi:hypothetical protein
MSPTHSPGYEPGLQVNPAVIELTRLADDLRQIEADLDGESSWTDRILERADAERRIRTEEEQEEWDFERHYTDNELAGLYSFAKRLDKLLHRANAAIAHNHLKYEIKSALKRIRDALMIPALTTLASYGRPDLDLEREYPRPDSDERTQFLAMRWRLLTEVVLACQIAAQEAQVLTQLADHVYVYANHIREQDRDMAGLARLSKTLPAVKTLIPLAPGGANHQQSNPPIDGTIKDSHIWLKGKPYRLTQGLRVLLSYLLTNDGAAEKDAIRHCAYSQPSHLHKRLKDLRNKLAKELKGSGWRLQIKTEDTRIYCEWREESSTIKLPTNSRRIGR